MSQRRCLAGSKRNIWISWSFDGIKMIQIFTDFKDKLSGKEGRCSSHGKSPMDQWLLLRHLRVAALFLVLFVTEGTSVLVSEEEKSKQSSKADQETFHRESQGDWKTVFSDSCQKDWKERWFLDGEIGTVENSDNGMTLTAGPEFKNDSHHMVLWTKEDFKGDLKIEYEYTRLDRENRCVTILYIQATGSGQGLFAKDIAEWGELRKVPSMRSYYDNMNLYHISYAAFGNSGKAKKSYIRGRRYMPHQKGLKGTDLKPDFYFSSLFQTDLKHHVTVIKKDRELFMKVENKDGVTYCHMKNEKLPIITEGRIGLRHMYTRSARYKNIVISRRE